MKGIIFIIFIVLANFNLAKGKELERNLIEVQIFQQDYNSQRLEVTPKNFIPPNRGLYNYEIFIKDKEILEALDKENKKLKELDTQIVDGVKTAAILKYSSGKNDTICFSSWFFKGIYKNGKQYEFSPKLLEIIQLVCPKELNIEFEWTKYYIKENRTIILNKP